MVTSCDASCKGPFCVRGSIASFECKRYWLARSTLTTRTRACDDDNGNAAGTAFLDCAAALVAALDGYCTAAGGCSRPGTSVAPASLSRINARTSDTRD